VDHIQTEQAIPGLLYEDDWQIPGWYLEVSSTSHTLTLPLQEIELVRVPFVWLLFDRLGSVASLRPAQNQRHVSHHD